MRGSVWVTTRLRGGSKGPRFLALDDGHLLWCLRGGHGPRRQSSTRHNWRVVTWSETPGSVTDVVHEAYRFLSDTYRAVGEDRVVDRTKAVFQPLLLGAEDGTEQAVAREMLASDLQDIIGHTGARIGEHVAALTALYQPSAPELRRNHPLVEAAENQRAPRSAAFTVARSILEGVSMFAWVCDAGVTQTERLRRTASISIWSAHYADIAHGSSTEPLVKARAKTADVGDPNWFNPTRVIKVALGASGSRLYAVWSGRAHHAPWAGLPGLLQRDHGDAVAYSSALEQPAQLELAADVTMLIRKQLDIMIDVLGKRRTADVGELERLEKYLRHCAEGAAEIVARQATRAANT